jgi:hypothetical protein
VRAFLHGSAQQLPIDHGVAIGVKGHMFGQVDRTETTIFIRSKPLFSTLLLLRFPGVSDCRTTCCILDRDKTGILSLSLSPCAELFLRFGPVALSPWLLGEEGSKSIRKDFPSGISPGGRMDLTDWWPLGHTDVAPGCCD